MSDNAANSNSTPQPQIDESDASSSRRRSEKNPSVTPNEQPSKNETRRPSLSTFQRKGRSIGNYVLGKASNIIVTRLLRRKTWWRCIWKGQGCSSLAYWRKSCRKNTWKRSYSWRIRCGTSCKRNSYSQAHSTSSYYSTLWGIGP